MEVNPTLIYQTDLSETGITAPAAEYLVEKWNAHGFNGRYKYWLEA